ncbi:MAG: PRD domain-containing protein, partial [Erysipelotrichaceae bacterium]|nr:PRD domain-containing protein [Erysipelotrichaceae bacterium]
MEKQNERNRLVQILRQKNDWMTSKELAKALDCSVRHIRYLISLINSESEIILSSDKGYRTKAGKEKKLIESGIPADARQRQQFIIENVVVRNRILDIDELLEDLAVSDATFKSELNTIRKDLSPYKIFLKTKNNKLFSVANASDRAAFSSSVIRDELKNNSFSLENTQRFFTKVELSSLKQIILGVLARHEFYLDEYSLMTYIIHLALCIENHKVGDGSTTAYYKELIQANNDDIIVMIVSEVFQELSKYYPGSSFTREDIFEASMLMTTRIIKRSTQNEKESLDAIVGKETAKLILKIVKDVNRVYSIDLNNERFLFRFAIHVKNALIRAKTNLSITEGQFIDLQEGYPFIYLIARYIAYKIKEETGVILSDNELSYIVLHIGAILEEATMQKEKLACVVVAPDYYVIGKNLCNKITQSLGDIVMISSLITDYDKLKESLNGTDLVVTTYDIRFDELPVAHISPFPDRKDLEELRTFCYKQKEIRNHKILSDKIRRFTNEDLLYLDTEFKDYVETIDVLCDDLYEKGLVLKEFKDELYAHEKIAFSSYNNVAIA